MNKHANPIAVLAIFCSAMLILACDKDDDGVKGCGNNFNFSAELSEEANELSAAAQIYANDQTTANCENYRSAYLDYLDAARDLEDCAINAGQQAEYLQAIEDAETAIENLQC